MVLSLVIFLDEDGRYGRDLVNKYLLSTELLPLLFFYILTPCRVLKIFDKIDRYNELVLPR